MNNIKNPNVAGLFYPQDSKELYGFLDKLFLSNTSEVSFTPKAVIAPHAGYIYSASVAIEAYRCIPKETTKVAILSPTHYYQLDKIAYHPASYFKTPLGDININQAIISDLKKINQVECIPEAFEKEHALEVHLPFLQYWLNDFSLVPLIVGQCGPLEVKEVIDFLIKNDVFIIISSDLSHFHTYEKAKELDDITKLKIESLDFDHLDHKDACGYYPLRGLLMYAKELGLACKTLEMKNSGDTAGDKTRVVGYGSYAII